LFFLQGKAPKEIHAILTETLGYFLPGRAKDFSALLYLPNDTPLFPEDLTVLKECFSFVVDQYVSFFMTLSDSFIDMCSKVSVGLQFYVDFLDSKASACHTDTTPTSHTETPTHVETRTHNQYGDTIEKSQALGDGYINVRNLTSIEEVK